MVSRPGVFFRPDRLMPETAELKLTVPEVFGHLSARQFGTRLAKSLAARQADLIAGLEAEGRRFLGREAVLRQSLFDAPVSEPERMGLNPRVACRDKPDPLRGCLTPSVVDSAIHSARGWAQ